MGRGKRVFQPHDLEFVVLGKRQQEAKQTWFDGFEFVTHDDGAGAVDHDRQHKG